MWRCSTTSTDAASGHQAHALCVRSRVTGQGQRPNFAPDSPGTERSASACLTRVLGSPADSALRFVRGGVGVNVDQQSLDIQPSALPGAGSSANGGPAKARRRGFAALHGPHSCGGCSAVWTGDHAAHCSACHSTFATVGLFDAHRSIAGDRGSCRNPRR
jgi:hypothetical protein